MENNQIAGIKVPEVYKTVVQYLNNNKYKEARDAVDRVPKDILWNSPALLNALGIAYRGLSNPQASIRCYLRALKIESSSVTWANLGNAYKDANMVSSAISAHKESIQLSDTPTANQWHNFGIALSIAGQHKEAIEAFTKSIEVDPSQQGVKWDLARSQLYIKDYSDGFSNYQYRWHMKDAPPRRVQGKEWLGQSINDSESLFVYVEQGFGDYIHCARYLDVLQKSVKRLSVEVKNELKDLMQVSFPSVNFIDFDPNPRSVDDAWVVSMLDLPRYFPEYHFVCAEKYLQQPLSKINPLLEISDRYKKFKNVGIVWAGSVTFKRNQYRSTTADKFIDSFNLPGVQLHSLQIGPMATQVEKLSDQLVSKELISNVSSFSDTAHVVKNLDLVISTCTSIVHLCGALGIPCWVLLDYSAHWLWGTTDEKSDWYRSLRFFRQPSPGDWRTVFDEATVALMDWKRA